MADIRNQLIIEGHTEAQILAFTSKNPGDIYISTDTSRAFAINLDGNPEAELRDVIYIQKTPAGISIPVLEHTEATGIHRLNLTKSILNGVEKGGVQGKHYLNISSNRTTVDLLGTTTPITIVPGLNVTVNGLDVEKNIAGNTWNSSFSSQLAFNPNEEDFAISWIIESVDGTIREMAGLDNDPTQNNSYSSIEYAVYQVNNYFYSRVYESGVATIIPNYTTFYFQVGDRCGIKCVNNIVSYFVIRGGVETVIYTSTKKATEPLYFKGAMNRGVGSSGESSIGNVVSHRANKITNMSVQVEGDATSVINSNDAEIFSSIGMEIQSGSLYSDIYFIRNAQEKFDNSGTPFDLNITHGYLGDYSQASSVVTF